MTDRYFPETLKNLPIWALWRLEEDAKNRPTKVPYSPHYNGRASSTNPKTWGTFDQAVSKYRSRPGYYNGISLIISKKYGLVFIDIDHCIDEEGVMNETASDILGSFHIGASQSQFIEFSQSGTGVHIIARGIIPKNFKNSSNGVEMYSDKRFCALTGNVLYTGDPTEDQTAIDYIYQRYKTPEREKKTVKTQNRALQNDDKWVIEHASRHGIFTELYSGDWRSVGKNSQSEADLSLCIILSYWTDRNHDQIDRIFRSSGLYREKWERDDYRESTIETAISTSLETVSDYIQRVNTERGESLDRALREEWDR